mgnify:CR=1 FL=1
MVQVDLITGFLGAGKTTFLRRYVAYLTAQGHHVCILENDFGAVNVDAMLVQDLLGERCEIETISGGCDCDTHQRRMRTKLISMAMRGFDRVVVEPSGIFDVDEFFDVLRDDPLDRWYHIGNVIAIVDAMLPETLSPQAEYVLASETANAGRVLVSRTQLAGQQQTAAAVAHLTRALEGCKCSRRFAPEEILTKEGYSVLRAYSGTEALYLLSNKKMDLVLLDLMLPGLSGEEVLPHIGKIPVIVLSAKVDVQDKVNLLLGGAADYMTKPFDTKELLARITVQLRRAEQHGKNGVLSVGDLALDTETFSLTVQGQAVKLTRTEYAILKLLMENPRQVIAKSVLLDRISMDTPDCTQRSLKQHISNLRKKLQAVSGGDPIETVWGIGFRLTEQKS